MADNEEDTRENSGDEERDFERPPTPDYHHHMGKEDDGFSDISDDEDKEKQYDKQKKTFMATDSPANDALELSRDDNEVKNSASIDEDSEEQDHESVDNENDSVDNTETISNDKEKDPLENETDENDIEKQEKLDSLDTSESVRDSDKITIEQENTTTNQEKNISNGEKEITEKSKGDEEGVPVSPLGLELSDPDITVAKEISKKDVEENFENETVESEEEDNKETKKDESDTKKDFEEKSVSDNEDDDENTSFAKDIDVLDDERSEADEAGGDQLIQDIFGASDEEEEFEGFDQDEIGSSRPKPDAPQAPSKSMLSDDEDEGVSGEVESMVVPEPKAKATEESDSEDEGTGTSHTVWDFDVMMEQKKASRAKKRKRKGDSELISDSDDLVVDMVKQMKQAAEDDKLLNEAKQAATKKLKLLPLVMTHLNKADLQFTFIDSGILNALKDWLSPLPDGSLPHLQIRTGLLKILSSFPALDTGALKMSGLGKAVMYIYRHPKETRQNRNIAGKLINEWARPIFGVTSNFKSMSREEREERDYQNMSKRRRLSSAEEGGKTPRSIDRALQGEKKGARPGEKGFIMRARVPTPSNKDYVVRPKSNVEALDFHRVNKVISRADKQMRKFKDRNKAKAPTHAATISIEGRKMAL